MRNYKRKRTGYGNLYVAIDKQLGLARIGFSTNLYTTMANLAYNWEIIATYQADNAGLIDKQLAQILASERAVNYQSSKSYKLNSYRVQKVIKLLGGTINYKCSCSYDICSCLNCNSPIECQYISVMSLQRFIKIHQEEMLCDECDYRPHIEDRRILSPKREKPNKDKRVWEYYEDRHIPKTRYTTHIDNLYESCLDCGTNFSEPQPMPRCLLCYKKLRRKISKKKYLD